MWSMGHIVRVFKPYSTERDTASLRSSKKQILSSVSPLSSPMLRLEDPDAHSVYPGYPAFYIPPLPATCLKETRNEYQYTSHHYNPSILDNLPIPYLDLKSFASNSNIRRNETKRVLVHTHSADLASLAMDTIKRLATTAA